MLVIVVSLYVLLIYCTGLVQKYDMVGLKATIEHLDEMQSQILTPESCCSCCRRKPYRVERKVSSVKISERRSHVEIFLCDLLGR